MGGPFNNFFVPLDALNFYQFFFFLTFLKAEQHLKEVGTRRIKRAKRLFVNEGSPCVETLGRESESVCERARECARKSERAWRDGARTEQ